MNDKKFISGAESPDRDRVIAMLEDAITRLHARLEEEPSSSDDEALFLKRVRTLGYLADQHRKLTRERDLDEMADDLELLKTGSPEK